MAVVVAQVLLVAYQAVDCAFLREIGFPVGSAKRVARIEIELMVFFGEFQAVVKVKIDVIAIALAVVQAAEAFQ